jgi:hypothetical protein
VKGPLWTIEQNIVPVGGIEILNSFNPEPGGLDLLAELDEFGGGPELVWVPGHSPGLIFAAGGLVLVGVRFALPEVVNQVHNHMRATRLNGKGVVLILQHVSVKAQTKFHVRLL